MAKSTIKYDEDHPQGVPATASDLYQESLERGRAAELVDFEADQRQHWLRTFAGKIFANSDPDRKIMTVTWTPQERANDAVFLAGVLCDALSIGIAAAVPDPLLEEIIDDLNARVRIYKHRDDEPSRCAAKALQDALNFIGKKTAVRPENI